MAYEALSRPTTAEGLAIDIGTLLKEAHGARELERFDRLAIPQIFEAARTAIWPTGILLFINVSPYTLVSPDFLLSLIKDSGIPAHQLVVEVSEREDLPAQFASDLFLEPFRQQGIRIALDDLGAGYSGLNRLVSLRPDYAKIDMDLVRNIDRNVVKSALVESTARFANKTGAISLIAEGIETEAELHTLREMGIDAGQGYYLCHPSASLASRIATMHTGRVAPLNVEDQLQALVSTAQFILQSPRHGKGFFTRLAHEVKRVIGADVVAFLAQQSDRFVVVESLPVRQGTDPHQHVPLDPLTNLYTCLTTRQSVVFQGPHEPGASPWDRAHQLKSGLIVPICMPDRCWGVLHVGFYQPNHVRPDIIYYAENLMRMMALGLPADTESDHASVGEPLYEALAALALEGNSEVLMLRILEAALAASQSHEGWIGVAQDDDSMKVLSLDGTSSILSSDDLFNPQSLVGQGPIGKACQARMAIFVSDIIEDPSLAPWRDDMLAQGIRSAAAIPLVVNDQLFGLLKLYNSNVDGFSPGRTRRVEALAQLASTSLAQFTRGTNEQMRQETLSFLEETLAFLSHSQDPIMVIQSSLQMVLRMTGAQAAAIWLPDNGTTVSGHFLTEMVQGPARERLSALRPLRHSRQQASDNLLSTAYWNTGFTLSTTSNFPTRDPHDDLFPYTITIPARIRSHVYGVLAVYLTRPPARWRVGPTLKMMALAIAGALSALYPHTANAASVTIRTGKVRSAPTRT